MNWKCFLGFHRYVYKGSQAYANYFVDRNTIDSEYFDRICTKCNCGWVKVC
jgi:hypothetical protein